MGRTIVDRRTALKLLVAGATLPAVPSLLALPFQSNTTSPERTDVLIYGGTPAGIIAALRAARLGLNVVLVSYYRHLGGMLSNGLGVFDTQYSGTRAPLFHELRVAIEAHYPNREGTTGYEPHVAEGEFERLIAAEPRIKIVREFYPFEAHNRQRQIRRITFKRVGGNELYQVEAFSYADASYVGDLAKVAGAEMITGRESRHTYHEPHAGVIYTRLEKTPITTAMKALNITPSRIMTSDALPGSTGTGDRAVQAYNFRVCLTHDPVNQIQVKKPSRYERDLYLQLKRRWKFTNVLPNSKTSWNAALLIGGNFDYPDGNSETRRQIEERHKDLAVGLLWFLQNDAIVPDKIRTDARRWGLPKDEFKDNGGFPWEVYVREGRRLVGRYIFTELDAELAPQISRAPVHADSIAITEWSLDSHSCNPTTLEDSEYEGKLLLARETQPGQVPYRCLLPKTIDNLLVIGAVASSHVGWGTIRLEPTWMHIAESAAYAISIAHRRKIALADINPEELLRTLVGHGVMVSFFNDFDMAAPTPNQIAAQYLGTQGFFSDYNARLDEPLTAGVAKVWARRGLEPEARAFLVEAEKTKASGQVTAAEFANMAGSTWQNPPEGMLTRGAACAWLFQSEV